MLLLFSSEEKLVGRWYVQHAAMWHWYLLLCIYMIFFIASVDSFSMYTFFLNLVLINRRNGPRYQCVLALCAFFNRGNAKGTNSSKILCSMFLYVLFYVDLCQD